MIITVVPIIMAIGGALMYALSANGNVKEIGRALMWAALFAFAFANSGKVVTL